MEKIEYLPVVDRHGNIIGKASREECHKHRLLHPVVHLHVFDHQGRLLLQKRSLAKLIQPGKWDTAVGGHVSYGESIEEALWRETSEEIGLSLQQAQSIASYLWDCPAECELVYSYRVSVPDHFVPCVEAGEADELRFWAPEDIAESIDCDLFTPNFVFEFQQFLKPLLNVE